MSRVVLQDVHLEAEPQSLDPHRLREGLGRAWGAGRGVLVGHAHEGVLWGVIEAGEVTISSDEVGFGGQLRADTLLDLRVFGKERELRLWHVSGELRAVCVREGAGGLELAAYQDGSYLLLGAERAMPEGSFARLEGKAGQRHAPPLGESGGPPRRVVVRHYYARDEETGLLRAVEHRWLRLLEDEP